MNSKKINPISTASRLIKNKKKMVNNLNMACSMTEKPLQIVVCGLLKAGKSTLLNMLTDHLQEELFKTGAVRTTIENQTFNHHKYTFVDTPGLDAHADDDKEAWQAIAFADILLLAHNLKNGELDSVEVDFLEAIKIINPNASKRLVVVLTNLESCRDEKDEIERKIIEKTDFIFRHEIKIFSISSTSYKKGMEEKKTNLAEKSGIPTLRKQILNILDEVEIASKNDRLKRIQMEREKICKTIEMEISNRNKKIIVHNNSIKRAQNEFEKEVEIVIENINQKISLFEKEYL